MCRLLAYLGPQTSLHAMVFELEHNLERQAWQPQELREATLNADGFGIGWYNDNSQIGRYRQILPIWAEPNFRDLSNSLERPLWLAYVRSATPGLTSSLENTQPFIFKQWQFLHNGYINQFASQVRGKIRQTISADLEAQITGSTDSEYLFILIMHFYQQSQDMIKALRTCFSQLEKWLGSERALLNVVLSDGVQIIASAHAINGLAPSLYYGKNIQSLPMHNQLIVSERLDDDNNWQAIEAQQLIRLRPGIAAEFIQI